MTGRYYHGGRNVKVIICGLPQLQNETQWFLCFIFPPCGCAQLGPGDETRNLMVPEKRTSPKFHNPYCLIIICFYTNNSTNYGGVLFSVHQNCRCRSAFQWGSNPSRGELFKLAWR